MEVFSPLLILLLHFVSGLALLSTVFRDEQERSRATGIAFGGLSVGIIRKDKTNLISYKYMSKFKHKYNIFRDTNGGQEIEMKMVKKSEQSK